jgi:hypothetical protein
MIRALTLSSAAALALFFAGCSGGGTAAVPSAPAPAAVATAGGTHALALAITLPFAGKSTVSSSSRAPAYVSPSTANIVIEPATYDPSVTPYVFAPQATVTIPLASAGCVAGGIAGTQICNVTIPGIAANVHFGLIVNVVDGSGNVLSTNQNDQGPGPSYTASLCGETIGAANVCTVALAGVPAAYTMSQSPPLTDGVAGTATLTVSATDADGNVIVDPPGFSYQGVLTAFAGANDGPGGLNAQPGSPHLTATHSGASCGTGVAPWAFFGTACAYTVTYDGTAGALAIPYFVTIEAGYASLSLPTSSVIEYQTVPVKFYPPKLPAGCSGTSSLTIPVPTPPVLIAPGTLTNGAPTC